MCLVSKNLIKSYFTHHQYFSNGMMQAPQLHTTLYAVFHENEASHLYFMNCLSLVK